MFTTLKLGPDQAPLVAIQESNGLPAQGQGHQHQACNRCREKKLKCTALKDGCDRCFSEGIVCKLPGKRRDSRIQQKAGVAKVATRRNEASTRNEANTRASKSNKNIASQAPTHKYTSSQTSNGSTTPETVTPTLTSCTSSASSKALGTPNLPNAHLDNGPHDFWHISSLDSENGAMAHSVSASDFNLQSLKSPPGLDDFFVDPDFDAFGHEQDDDRFFDNMDLDFGNNDDLEMPKVGKSLALNDGYARSMVSPFGSRQDSPVHRRPSAPPTSPWNNTHRSISTPVPSGAPTKEAEHDPDIRPTQCGCLGVTLSLLEKAHFRDTRLSVSNWMGLLHEFKKWMRSFRDVTECTACNCTTDSLMLLVVVCEKLGDSFQIISTIYEKLADALSVASSSRTPEMCTLGGEYSVDTVEEFVCLFKFLALRHLKSLYRTIKSLDNTAIQQELTTHHESLYRQIDRLRLLKGTIDQAHLNETAAGREMMRKR